MQKPSHVTNIHYKFHDLFQSGLGAIKVLHFTVRSEDNVSLSISVCARACVFIAIHLKGLTVNDKCSSHTPPRYFLLRPLPPSLPRRHINRHHRHDAKLAPPPPPPHRHDYHLRLRQKEQHHRLYCTFFTMWRPMAYVYNRLFHWAIAIDNIIYILPYVIAHLFH